MAEDDKRPLIVFDLDGTLALTDHRQHFLDRTPKDWQGFFDACDRDLPNEGVLKLLHVLRETKQYRIEIWTGRSDAVVHKTILWLYHHNCEPDMLCMRSDDDYTPDEELKRRWLHELDEPPVMVFDDRKKVVNMWRNEGILCLQVADGEF